METGLNWSRSRTRTCGNQPFNNGMTCLELDPEMTQEEVCIPGKSYEIL